MVTLPSQKYALFLSSKGGLPVQTVRPEQYILQPLPEQRREGADRASELPLFLRRKQHGTGYPYRGRSGEFVKGYRLLPKPLLHTAEYP